MEVLQDQTLWVTIVVALLALSEVLGTFALFKDNSVFQLIVSILKRFAPTKKDSL